MFVRSIGSLTLMATLSFTGAVCGQGAGMDDGGGASLGVTLQALETMNNAAAAKLTDALAHQKALESYVAANGMVESCGQAKSNDGHEMAMTFEQALQIAIDHEQTSPAAGAADNATAGEVKAYTTLTRSTWDKLQTAMAAVDHLSDCIHGHGKTGDFDDWSHAQEKSHHEAMAAKAKEVGEENLKEQAATEKKIAQQYKDWQAAQAKKHQEYLQHAWTQYKFNTNANLKAYKYSKEYGPNSYNQTYAGNRYGGGSGYPYGGWGGGY